MRHSLALVAALSVSLLCAGCGDPTIDASSEETMKTSVEEVGKSLDQAKREQFEEAVAMLGISVVQSPGVFGDEAAMKKKMKETFDGKTADEIIAAGEKAKAENKQAMEQMLK
jgi:hypothetical protein